MSTPTTTSTELLVRASSGDRDALGELYQRHRGDVLRYITRRVTSRDDAEDLASDVWVRALAAVHRWRPMSVEPVGWLLTIARNRVADYRREAARRRRYHGDLPDRPDPAPGPEEVAEASDSSRRLCAALDQLPADQRTVLVWQYVANQSQELIGAHLNRSVGAVKALRHRGLRRLARTPEVVEVR